LSLARHDLSALASPRFTPLLAATLCLLGAAAPAPAEEVREAQRLLGAIVETVVDAPDRQTGEYWIDQAVEVGRRLERELRTDDERSEVGKLNQQAGQGPVRVTVDLYRLLTLSQLLSRITGGAFDPTVGALVRARSMAAEAGREVEDAVDAALGHVGYDRVILHPPDRVELARAGMALDFGLLAKGYAASRMAARLRELGATRALLRFGDVYVAIGPGRRDPPWRIDVPRGNAIAGSIALRDRAAAIVHSLQGTDDGQRASGARSGGGHGPHIIDPRSGRWIEADRQAVVVALDAAIAAGWAVAMIVDPDGVAALLETPRDVHALGYDEHGEHRTSRFDAVAGYDSARRSTRRDAGADATGKAAATHGERDREAGRNDAGAGEHRGAEEEAAAEQGNPPPPPDDPTPLRSPADESHEENEQAASPMEEDLREQQPPSGDGRQ